MPCTNFLCLFASLSDLHNSFSESGAKTAQTEHGISGRSSYFVNSPCSSAFEFGWPVSLATLHFHSLISRLSERRDYIASHAVAFWSICSECRFTERNVDAQEDQSLTRGGVYESKHWELCSRKPRHRQNKAANLTPQRTALQSCGTHIHTKFQAQIFLWKWSIVLQSVRMVTA